MEVVRRRSSPAAFRVFCAKLFQTVWCKTTAAAIFPKRTIGQLKDGYETNFLVLTGNPLPDFANVKTIELRVKQGEPLQ